MSIEVQKPGLWTTVQDGGRWGARKYGVVVSGAMDRFAYRVANALVGNEPQAAALELTLLGPELCAGEDVLLAICGIGCRVEAVPPGGAAAAAVAEAAPLWRPFLLRAGTQLRFRGGFAGSRAYVALGGGVAAEPVLGSRSTYVRAALGGVAGRPLVAGDAVQAAPAGAVSRRLAGALAGTSAWRAGAALAAASWAASARIWPAYGEAPELRVLPGREAGLFTAASVDAWRRSGYRVAPQSDRMGCRLQGTPLALAPGADAEMLSEAVAPGTVQIPPDGQPIILAADCQTTGGYPRLAHVIDADLPLLAQLKPGDTVYFREVSLREAQEALLLRELDLRMLAAAVRARAQEAGAGGL
ncbi:biotin-dependent carboxyltransferase [Paenibacillus athensensis]|uniref:Carboxyltransferase domain-containing protein n=1 Tax=Paenibacillus athensensis TaxID=1967502 RepID=A0A4Y8PXZ0_9BACL|nr:biotin-dependent carboxyltransferase family protein [Paenibacillus athensensis]MCD1259334.1 biotin-dependent carboxyltransferase [Paenibacillus athensensis]